MLVQIFKADITDKFHPGRYEPWRMILSQLLERRVSRFEADKCDCVEFESTDISVRQGQKWFHLDKGVTPEGMPPAEGMFFLDEWTKRVPLPQPSKEKDIWGEAAKEYRDTG